MNCVEAGVCTARKNQICDNAWFLVSGSSDQRAKCCPDTSGCVKNALEIVNNSVCSTKCGACLGEVGGGLNKVPIVFCEFAEDANNGKYGDLGLQQCYDKIVKPFCQDVVALQGPTIDVGLDKCSAKT